MRSGSRSLAVGSDLPTTDTSALRPAWITSQTFCRRERADGIAGYSNGGGAALLVAAARDAGEEAFQSAS
jgi:S-formylglutathione hydrolase FrmB